MNRSSLPIEAQRRRMLLLSGGILAVVAVSAGLWRATDDGNKPGVPIPADSPAVGRREGARLGKVAGGQKAEVGEGGADETEISDSHKQPLQFRAKAVKSVAVLLSRGYERDQQEKSLEEVREQAFTLARNPNTG